MPIDKKKIKSFVDEEFPEAPEPTNNYFEKFRNKPFYCQPYASEYYEITEDEDEQWRKKNCCFTHMVGLPRKLGKIHPLYDYQEHWNEIEKTHRYRAMIKPTGVGATTYKTRRLAWKSLKDDNWKGQDALIVFGTRQDEANIVIDDIKKLFPEFIFKSRMDRIVLNGCKITAYPSAHVASMRSKKEPKILLVDEFDFFRKSEQQELMTVCERYIAKGDPELDLISTRNLTTGLAADLLSDKNSIYYVEQLDYKKCIDRIYTKEEIEKAKKSKHFNREYGLQPGYGLGDIYDNNLLKKCFVDKINISKVPQHENVLCLDPAYGSSKFGIIGLYKDGDVAHIVLAEELTKPSSSQALKRISEIIRNYEFNTLWIDSAHPNLIREFSHDVSTKAINFATQGAQMIDNSSRMVDENRVRIPKKFQNLITQLMSAKRKDTGQLDKSRDSLDLVDAFNMACWFIKKSSFGYAGIAHYVPL